MKTALFPGSFDPFTIGHQALVDEGLKIFDRIVVAIGDNNEKRGLLSVHNRKALIEEIYAGNSGVEVAVYDGLTGEYCRERGIRFILRGMRNTVDFDYERNMMQINERLFPEITTVPLFTPPELAAVSSSVLRDLISFGGNVDEFIPAGIDINKYL